MWRFFIKASISIALIALLLLHQNLALLLHELANVAFGVLLVGTALFAVLTIVLALRWSAILAALDSPCGLRTTVPLVFIGQFFSQALPSGIGGDVARMWLARNHGVRLAVAVSSVVVDRLSGVVALLVLATVALPQLFGSAPARSLTDGTALLLAAAYCGLAVILALDRAPIGLDRFRIVRGLRRIAVDARAALLRPQTALQVLGYSFLNQIGVVLVVYILAGALGVPVSMSACLLVVPVANLLQALPISIAGWGVREGSFVAGFGLFGIPSKDALLLSILFGLVVLVASMPGSVLWLTQKRQAHESAFPLQEPVEALTLAQPE